MVFAHGLGEHSGLYQRFADEIGAQGVDLWALDLTGHGRSDGERGRIGTIDGLAADLRQLTTIARAAAPELPIAVAGHSLGSLVALTAALDHPQDYASVVLSGAPLSAPSWLVDAETTSDAVELDPAALSSDPAYLEQLAGDPLVFTSGDIASVLLEALSPVWQRLPSDLRRLRLPVLAVHGANDAIAPLAAVEPWSERLPDFRIEVVDNAGHDVLNEVEHRRIADRLARFVVVRADLLARAS